VKPLLDGVKGGPDQGRPSGRDAKKKAPQEGTWRLRHEIPAQSAPRGEEASGLSKLILKGHRQMERNREEEDHMVRSGTHR